MKRAVAHRVWIKDLAKGEYVPSGDISKPTVLKTEGKEITRVDLVGKIIEKDEGQTYSTLVLQDRTGKIKIRAFGSDNIMMEEVQNGDLARVIGKIKQDNVERFVAGEIIKKIEDANYGLLREKELEKDDFVEEVSL
jgi:RPA family protein